MQARHFSFFSFIAWALASGVAYADFVISLKEIPEWSPGRPLEIRHITIDGNGTGGVVVTNEDMDRSKVLQIARFEYDTNDFAHWAREYDEYEDFYGIDENSDGRIVEGNPETVAISFFNDGQLMKSIVLSDEFAYGNNSAEQLHLPKALVTLRDRILAYAAQAKSQLKAHYYATATPYSKNQKYWLFRSTKLESIPMLSNTTDERDRMFLAKLVKSAPIFLPLVKERFLRLTRDLKFSDNRRRGIFRTSEKSDTIVEINLVESEIP